MYAKHHNKQCSLFFFFSVFFYTSFVLYLFFIRFIITWLLRSTIRFFLHNVSCMFTSSAVSHWTVVAIHPNPHIHTQILNKCYEWNQNEIQKWSLLRRDIYIYIYKRTNAQTHKHKRAKTSVAHFHTYTLCVAHWRCRCCIFDRLSFWFWLPKRSQWLIITTTVRFFERFANDFFFSYSW